MAKGGTGSTSTAVWVEGTLCQRGGRQGNDPPLLSGNYDETGNLVEVHHKYPIDLARIIHERFCCNRRSAAATSLRPAGSPLRPSTYCTSTRRVLRAPRAGLATRLRDFATNRHE
ncbi:hypothetical protein NITMOv2_3304 [Nitrospira moscoviensis]|uniref:Uncharacterized protein n=1 Tax=Nitrospira moscoviensis TaxID=42253 RepID=A0A0K2GGD9_NITMO|nr:hypothetical protein NITMOv2_3304 [Nitrospira moscoviensis]